jgi:hypothetical protein
MTTASATGALLDRGLDSSSGLGFVRERLAVIGKTLFLVPFGFYLVLLASLVWIGSPRRRSRSEPPRTQGIT